MKKISFLLMAFGLMVTSCTKDDFDYSYMDSVKQNYNDLFTLTFGDIAPGHDWGFHADATGNRAAMRAAMRAAETWSNYHVTDDEWMDDLEDVEKPADAITVTDGMKFDSNKNYYIPADFTGKFYTNNCNWVKLYVAGKVTQSQYGDDNANDLNVYILEGGIWECKFSGSNRVTIYNKGTLKLPSDALQSTNIGKIYNGGSFVLGDGTQNIQIGDGNVETRIHSNDKGTVLIEGKSITFGCGADIHGKMKVTGDIDELQTDKKRYVCGLEVTGRLYLNKGALYTSYVKADKIDFNCFPLYLLPGGHVVTNAITMPNSGIYVKGYTGSTGFVEVGNIVFENDNDFNRTFSDNIYFKIDGSIDMTGQTNGGFTKDDRILYNNADEYIAAHGNLNNRINNTEISGVSECGGPWGNIPTETSKIVKEGQEKMIIAEDLAAGQFNADFDFNDVVFLAHVNVEKDANNNLQYVAYVKLLAAGGTLPLYIVGETREYEVHKMFFPNSTEDKTGTMINTGADLSEVVDLLPTFELVLGSVKKGDNYEDADFLVRKINDIQVWVRPRTTAAYELTTKLGNNTDYMQDAPMKIAVDPAYKWTKERKAINTVYEMFPAYVQDPESNGNWWTLDNCKDTGDIVK